MSQPRIGIIGGSGLGQAFREQAEGREVSVETPFGPASGPILLSNWQGVEIAFLSRHGPGHLLNPSAVPYRANIYALKSLGVSHVIATGAVGSLREEVAPRHLVICDQVIDKTHKRASTFFDEGMVAHVEFAEPFCPKLRSILVAAGAHVEVPVHSSGTYVCMEGPQFSTRAESLMHRGWGGTLIGMTLMPEGKLAREAEMSYAAIALVTDYDCWRPHDAGKSSQALLAEILSHLEVATSNAIGLLKHAVPALAKRLGEAWPHADALKLAIWSDKSKVARERVEMLGAIVGRYFEGSEK